MDVKRRNSNLDLVRFVAVFSVLSVHFFLNNEFYSTIVAGKRMYVMVLMRTAFMVCVPMFLLLTGYLCSCKALSRKYYRGILRILTTYLVISIACLVFRRFYLLEDLSLFTCLIYILDFRACSYAWYIEMYIGLFLLIPFLNVLYHSLNTKRKKQLLVLTCLILTTLPSVFNIFDWITPGFWQHPYTAANLYQIVPDWWTSLYPLTYYFIGAYIREYDVSISRRHNFALLIGCIVLFGSMNYYWYHGSTFNWPTFTSWNGFQNVIDTVLLFILLLHLKISRWPRPILWLIQRFSVLSLGIYLASYISDQFLYPKLLSAVPDMTMRLNYYLPVVLASFFLSAIISQLSQWLLTGLGFLGRKAARSLPQSS